MQRVLVLDKNKKPLMPCYPSRATELLRKGETFIIELVDWYDKAMLVACLGSDLPVDSFIKNHATADYKPDLSIGATDHSNKATAADLPNRSTEATK